MELLGMQVVSQFGRTVIIITIIINCYFIIHPCDPTAVICYLIWLCDTAVPITYLISHTSSLSYTTVIKRVGCIINTKLPSCVDIIRCTSLSFPSWCPESTRPTDSCFQGTSWKNLMMYRVLYQHTRVVLYIYQTPIYQPVTSGSHKSIHSTRNYIKQNTKCYEMQLMKR